MRVRSYYSFVPNTSKHGKTDYVSSPIFNTNQTMNQTMKKKKRITQSDFHFVRCLREKNENGSIFVFVFLQQIDKLEIEFRYPFIQFLISIENGV